jgi:predicted acetyltransferase
MMAAAGEFRPLGQGDDLEALFDLRTRAFGPSAADERRQWQAETEHVVGERRYFAVFDGNRIIAAARVHDMIQWWHGRPLPMAGVATVMVAPEDRGRGAGRHLMTELLAEITRRGYPLSALYPATTALYRPLGWEIAGNADTAVLPSRALRSLSPPDVTQPGTAPLRRAQPQDAAEVIRVLGRNHEMARDCGPVTRDEATVRRFLADPDWYCYLAPDGFLAYRWHGHSEIFVERAVAVSEATTRALWGIVSSHGSIARTVRAHVGSGDPIWWLTRERDIEVSKDTWMLRAVDPAAAIAGRGFPPGTEVTAWIRLEDAALPANSGLWTLEVSGGKGALTRSVAPAGRTGGTGNDSSGTGGTGTGGSENGGSENGGSADGGAVTVGARGFAAMFAGIPLATLRRAGLAVGGDPGTDPALDAPFAAASFLLDHF